MLLRRATAADAGLLRRWDEQPHVRAADPGGDWAWDDELPRTAPWRELLIAEHEGRPIGFVQILDAAEEPTGYWGPCPAGTRAIDIWIGEPSDLGRGLGTLMMQAALERCFDDPGIQAVVVDPLAENVRAHRFYERLGFHFVERRDLGGDDTAVYRILRPQGT